MGETVWEDYRRMVRCVKRYVKEKYGKDDADHVNDFKEFAEAIGQPWNGKSTYWVDWQDNPEVIRICRLLDNSPYCVALIKVLRIRNDIDAGR